LKCLAGYLLVEFLLEMCCDFFTEEHLGAVDPAECDATVGHLNCEATLVKLVRDAEGAPYIVIRIVPVKVLFWNGSAFNLRD